MEKYIYRYLVDFDFTQAAMLCSQMEFRGSVPRKDYPVMVALDNGRSVGTIGGGILEYSVLETARLAFADQQARFESFELTGIEPEGDTGICGGTTRVLIEPFTPELQKIWAAVDLENLVEPGLLLITKISMGETIEVTRWLIYPDGAQDDVPAELSAAVGRVWESGKSGTWQTSSDFYLLQLIRPFPVLHIFGAGHVGKALADIAHFIDCEVIIYDDRPDLANDDIFPHAKRIVVQPFETMMENAAIFPHDFVVIMTRGHRNDLLLLRQLVNRKVRYLGLMSSRNKWQLLARTLREEGITQAALEAVKTPVGLEIASETVPEIAVSIIAQIIQTMRSGRESDPVGEYPEPLAGGL